MNCQDIPQILEERPHRKSCSRLAEMLPECCCEQESICPKLSPGIVKSDETLARFVPLKDLDSDTKMVKASLFEKASENGLSVTRIELAGAQNMALQQESGRFLGYVTAICDHVRTKMYDERRLFGVYDTALESNRYHADICQTTCAPGSLAIKLRRELQEAFTREIPAIDN